MYMRSKVISISNEFTISGGKGLRSFQLATESNYYNMLSEVDQERLLELLATDHKQIENSRTCTLTLKNPIFVDYGNITVRISELSIKGIRFDSNEVLVPHTGRGAVINSYSADENGKLIEKLATTTPNGAALFSEARDEFHMTKIAHESDILLDNKVFTKIPIGYGKYPNINYIFPNNSLRAGEEENVGFIIFGVNPILNIRTEKGVVASLPKAYLAEMRELGSTLRSLHEANIYHSSLHGGNIFIAPQIRVVHDLPDSIDLSNMSMAQKTTYMFRDLFYAASKVESVMREVDDKRIAKNEGERTVLDGYFGVDTAEIFDHYQLNFLFTFLQSVPFETLNYPLLEMLKSVACGLPTH